MKARCKGFLDNMITATKEDLITKPFLLFLGKWTHNKQIPPQSYLFDFEVNRLAYDSFAQLSEMNVNRAYMIVSFFIIIRMLLNRIVLRPWSVIDKIQSTDQVKA